jgi:hypothetical protein
MGKEQISIRLEPEILQKLDGLAAIEKRTRNNMLEVLISEALKARISNLSDELFEQLKRLSDRNLKGEALKEEIKRANELTKAVKQKRNEYTRILRAEPKTTKKPPKKPDK